jgi:hypothetical protein
LCQGPREQCTLFASIDTECHLGTWHGKFAVLYCGLHSRRFVQFFGVRASIGAMHV